MFFPHPCSRHRPSVVSRLNSLKTLLVLSHRRIPRPSLQLAWRISGSPNLIVASRNVLRQSSRPHRCALQRFTSDRVWAAVLATTTSLRIFLQVLMQGGPGQVRSTSSFRVILHDPRSIHYIQERFLLRHRLWAASAGIAFLALPPRAVAIRSGVLEIFGS